MKEVINKPYGPIALEVRTLRDCEGEMIYYSVVGPKGGVSIMEMIWGDEFIYAYTYHIPRSEPLREDDEPCSLFGELYCEMFGRELPDPYLSVEQACDKLMDMYERFFHKEEGGF